MMSNRDVMLGLTNDCLYVTYEAHHISFMFPNTFSIVTRQLLICG
jgi:hypothetical protein